MEIAHGALIAQCLFGTRRRMKKILIAAWVVAAAAVAVESSAAPADDAIKQVFAQVDACLAKRDAKCVGALFAEDATYLAPIAGAKIVKGRAAIISTIEKSMGPADAKRPTTTHAVESVRMISETHAIVDSAIQFSADAPPETYRDVSVMVLEGGKWLCQDVRFYMVGGESQAKTEPAPAAKE
jgi:uncharacterized protein (TIGR02246 family)